MASSILPLPVPVAQPPARAESPAKASLLLDAFHPPLAIGAFLELASSIATVVANLHARGITHLGINPSTIALDGFGAPELIASDSASSTASPVPTTSLAAIAYIAPEQTGRVDRLVDQRSDLYSLGVVFYELLTGAPPFRADSSLELVHAHVARVPVSPSVITPQVPTGLANIVLKLLAKAPEHRYQTAAALRADLRTATDRYHESGTVAPFDLGALDLTLQLPFPDRLYGRERELDALRRALARVTAGRTELVLVSGPAGIGKSALVHALATEVVERGGRFVEGKVDLRCAKVPYGSLVEALEHLLAGVALEPDDVRASWRERILAALGTRVGLLTELVPHLTDLIGPQTPLPPIEPIDVGARLYATLRAFLDLFAVAGHPMVILLDDLQWADRGTIDIVRAFASDPASRHLLFVAAIRDSEIDADHPVARLQAELRELGTPPLALALEPLARDAIEHLLNDTLGRNPGVARLAELVGAKTAGNPLFIQVLLRSLQRAGLISFEPAIGIWRLDIDRIARATITDNVVDLLVATIARLSSSARDVLHVAACAGKLVELATLAQVLARSDSDVRETVHEIVHTGLLVVDVQPRWRGGVAYRFSHDRVQQAAYAMLSEAERQQLHLRIGRHLVEAGLADERGLFDAADQLNLGAGLITSPEERIELAWLDARAAQKAQQSGAHRSALDYLRAGIAVLPAGTWRDDHALAFALVRGAAESALLVGDHALSERFVREALAQPTCRAERAELYRLQVIGATVRAAWSDALEYGRLALRDLGFGEGFPTDLAASIATEMRAVESLVHGRSPEALLAEPLAPPEDEVILRLLVSLHHPAWFHDSALFAFLCARTLRFVLEHGHGPASIATATDWAMCLAATDQFAAAEGYAQLAYRLAARFGDRGHESHATFIDAAFIKPWLHAYRSVVPQLVHALALATACGDVRTLAYARSSLAVLRSAAGRDLDQLLRDLDADWPFLEQTRYGSMLRFQLAYRQGIRALKGLTSGPNRFDDDDFSEAEFLASVRTEPATRAVYEVRRLFTSYILRDIVEAGAHADMAGWYVEFLAAYIPSVEFNFFGSLTYAAMCEGVTPERRAELVERIRTNQRRLAGWVPGCVANFRHKHLLVEAELARIEGRHGAATELYDEATEAASASHILHEEALARELAGRYALGRGRKRTAELHLREALQGYARWGATAKVRALEDEFPAIRLAVQGVGVGLGQAELDLASVIRAVATLSTEVDLDGLLDQLLRVCLEAAGAERAVVILEEADGPYVRVAGTILAPAALEHTPLGTAGSLPVELVEQVRASRTAIVIDDGARDLRCLDDTYCAEHPIKSMLVVPVQRQDKLVAVLYFENNLITRAFTPGRISVLELLASLVTGSLQNSLLVEQLRAEVLERTRAEHDLEAAVHMRDEFVSIAAHELRTPLTSLTLATQGLMVGAAARDPMLVIIDRQVGRLARLVDELMDVTRLQSRQLVLQLERVDLADVVRATAESFSHDLARTGSKLSLSTPAPVTGCWDRLRLEQVVGNLLSNAIKFGAGRPIAVDVTQVDGTAILTVSDLGIGIPADRIGHIFERFGRAVSVRSFGGLGLGLYITWVIVVTALGGRIFVDSEIGKGSRFVVELPTSRPHEESHG